MNKKIMTGIAGLAVVALVAGCGQAAKTPAPAKSPATNTTATATGNGTGSTAPSGNTTNISTGTQSNPAQNNSDLASNPNGAVGSAARLASDELLPLSAGDQKTLTTEIQSVMQDVQTVNTAAHDESSLPSQLEAKKMTFAQYQTKANQDKATMDSAFTSIRNHMVTAQHQGNLGQDEARFIDLLYQLTQASELANTVTSSDSTQAIGAIDNKMQTQLNSLGSGLTNFMYNLSHPIKQ